MGQEEKSFAVEDTKIDVTIFNNLLRQMRHSPEEQNLYNLLRHHTLARPERVNQGDSSIKNSSVNSNSSSETKKESKLESARSLKVASRNYVQENSSSNNYKSNEKGKDEYSKKKVIHGLLQKGLFHNSLEMVLIATKVILKDFQDHGDLEEYG